MKAYVKFIGGIWDNEEKWIDVSIDYYSVMLPMPMIPLNTKGPSSISGTVYKTHGYKRVRYTSRAGLFHQYEIDLTTLGE